HVRGHARQLHRGRGRGRGLVPVRRGLEGDLLLHPLHPGPRLSPGRPLRPARSGNAGRLSMIAPLRSRPGAVALFGLAALTPLVVHDAYFLDSLVLILLWGALSAAWNVAGGYAGQVSIGHASFFGLGAYAAALMVTRFGRSPWLGMLVRVVLSVGAGVLISFLSNRLKGPYFALSTIAFSQVLLIGVSRWRVFTAGG